MFLIVSLITFSTTTCQPLSQSVDEHGKILLSPVDVLFPLIKANIGQGPTMLCEEELADPVVQTSNLPSPVLNK